jgi:hypothetical protein
VQAFAALVLLPFAAIVAGLIIAIVMMIILLTTIDRMIGG